MMNNEWGNPTHPITTVCPICREEFFEGMDHFCGVIGISKQDQKLEMFDEMLEALKEAYNFVDSLDIPFEGLFSTRENWRNIIARAEKLK
jgi:hypothetical protein